MDWMTGLQRFNGGAVAALLTANAFALVALVDQDGDRPQGIQPASAAPGAETPDTITLVTTEDGQTFLADPGTEAGRQAIDIAREAGASVVDVTRPDPAGYLSVPTEQPAPGTTPAAQAAPAARQLPADLSLLPRLPLDLRQLPQQPAGPGGGGSLLDPTIDGVQRTVDGTLSTVVGVVNDTIDGVQEAAPTPLDPTIGTVQGVVNGTVDAVQDTVGSVPALLPEVTNALGAVTEPITGGTGGLLGP